jgi:MFS family permease
MGVFFAVFSVRTSLGPFIGGALVPHSSWRWVVSVQFKVGDTDFAHTFRVLRQSPDRRKAFVCLFFFLHVTTKPRVLGARISDD